MKRKLIAAALVVSMPVLAACLPDAKIASDNLSKAADMFEINRRVVFYNGITGEYMMTLEGRCSIEDQSSQLEVTCKTGQSDFKKHFLGLSDNVTYFVEQIDGIPVSVYHHRIVWKPQSIIPEIDLRGDMSDLTTNRH
jgi:hypothetical protein